jgi:hypothetical protein
MKRQTITKLAIGIAIIVLIFCIFNMRKCKNCGKKHATHSYATPMPTLAPLDSLEGDDMYDDDYMVLEDIEQVPTLPSQSEVMYQPMTPPPVPQGGIPELASADNAIATMLQQPIHKEGFAQLPGSPTNFRSDLLA